jgi:hypothetical protein
LVVCMKLWVREQHIIEEVHVERPTPIGLRRRIQGGIGRGRVFCALSLGECLYGSRERTGEMGEGFRLGRKIAGEEVCAPGSDRGFFANDNQVR